MLRGVDSKWLISFDIDLWHFHGGEFVFDDYFLWPIIYLKVGGRLRAQAWALDTWTHLGIIMTHKVKSWVTWGQVVVIYKCTNGLSWHALCLTASKPTLLGFLTLNYDLQKWGNGLKQLCYWLTTYFCSLPLVKQVLDKLHYKERAIRTLNKRGKYWMYQWNLVS